MNNDNESKTTDYKPFYQIVTEALDTDDGAEILARFGLTKDTADMFGLGLYDPGNDTAREALRQADEDTAEAFEGLTEPHIIVPHGKGYFIAVHSDPSRLARYVPSRGTPTIWNKEGLYTSTGGRPVLIVADLMDALALAQAGGDVLRARGKVAEAELRNAIEAKAPTGPLVLLPDKPSNYESMKEYANGLMSQGLNVLTFEYPEAEEDEEPRESPAKILEQGRAEELANLLGEVADWLAQGNKDEANAYRLTRSGASIPSFKDRLYIEKSVTPTGFIGLDEYLGGGLYQSLTIIGAVSSMGKTTFCLQMADYIAENGRDVLFFTLEQSQDELIAKSISRISHAQPMIKDTDPYGALVSREILYKPDKVAGHRVAVENAIDYYQDGPGEHLYFIENGERRIVRHKKGGELETLKDSEGNEVLETGRVGLDTIRERIAQHIRITGTKPVVFIDYLQMIQPDDPTGRKSDKQNMDETVSELRRISKAQGIPIIAISSFNRDSYNTSVSLSSFKESGAIEYSSDVLIGIQPFGLGNASTDSEKGKNKNRYDDYVKRDVKPVEVKVLKNRLGGRGSFYMKFEDDYGYFESVHKPEDVNAFMFEYGPSEADEDDKPRKAKH